MSRKGMKTTLYSIIFLVTIFLAFFVSAVDTYNYYFEDPVIPHPEKIDVKNNLLVDLFSGAAVYKYPIDIPPGTNGLQPYLNLEYNSHSMYGSPGILGSGWSISEDYIQINTNGTFEDQSDDSFTLLLNGVSYSLVNTSNGMYHTKTESFFFVNKTTGGDNYNGDYWILKNPDGTTYRFGYYNFSEILSNSYNYAWRWNLDLINDTYGNSIFYNYTKNPYPLDEGVTYLDKIQYNNDKDRSINFYYQPEDFPYLRTFYDDGNLLRQSRLLEEIEINVSNKVIKKYSFKYGRLDLSGVLYSISNITEYGNISDTLLPPIEFEYRSSGSSNNYTSWSFPNCNPIGYGDGCFTSGGVDMGARLADINGDGLVDVIKAANLNTSLWINNGTGFVLSNWSSDGCMPNNIWGCFLIGGADNWARLADINGDGLVDMIEIANLNTSIFLNNGTGFHYTNWSFDGCNPSIGSDSGCFNHNSLDAGARLADINGDGLVDVIKARDYNTTLWINNGTGFVLSNWSFDGCVLNDKLGCFTYSGSDQGARLADINGDGLVDVIKAANLNTSLWINNGTGFHYTNWSFPNCNPIGYGDGCFTSGGVDMGARLADINGDGLVDVIKAANLNTSLWINNGTGFHYTNWSFGYCNPIGYGDGCFTSGGVDMGARLADINGDGLADIIRARDLNTSLWINNGGANYLLNKIDFSLGGEATLSYQKSTSLNNNGNDADSDLSFNLWLVSNITNDNKATGVENTIFIANYNFSGGYYDYATKEFRGFNMAEEKIGDKITKHWFHQDQEKIGKEYKTEILDNLSNPYKTIENTWNSTDLGSYYLVLLTGDSETDYDGMGSDPKIINNTYSYDSFGNVVYKHSLGDVSDLNDDKFEIYFYVNNSDKWIVNKINNYTLFSSDNSTVLKNSIYFYDNSSFGASPTKGSLTKNEEMINVGAKQTKVYEYNTFGNKIKFTDSNGIVTKYGYGTKDTTNTFPDNMTNSKNQSAIYFYDLGSGNLLAQSDSNNFVKNYTYDALSIDKSTVLPFDTIGLPTQEYEYNFTSPNAGKIVIKQREQNNTSNTLDKYKFYDGFGRLIQTKTEAINGKQIAVDYYYDLSGRIKAQTNPYFVSASTDYSTPNTTVGRTNYTYDVLDRVIEVITQDGSIKNISYSRWNVSIKDENGNNATYTKDAYGRIVKVIEYNGVDKYITSYLYDSSNNLLSITDSLNNTLNYTYDSLGRKIKEKDLDRGTWNYTYDSEGNLIKQFDARNISTSWVYDSLNRKINETSLGGSILFFYDLGLNGTLSSAKINATIINYTYDGRLRKITEKVNVTSQKSYSTNWTYDSSDRVTSQIMPDGRVINYTYDDQGLLSSISEVVGINYNENSNPTSINYSNGLNTSYSYNSSNFRLVQIDSPSKQNLNYQYDPVGNVLSIVDNVHSTNYSMAYDQLNRLSSTIITGDYNVVFGFIYDQIGNIRNITGNYAADYYYQDSRPHATSQVVYY